MLKGSPAELRPYADRLIGLRGVKHGQLVLSSARMWRAEEGSEPIG